MHTVGDGEGEREREGEKEIEGEISISDFFTFFSKPSWNFRRPRFFDRFNVSDALKEPEF